MADPKRPSEARAVGARCDDVTEAAAAAEKMISRMQDIVTEAIQPTGDPVEGFNELIEELDPAPEGEALRHALGMDEHGTREIPRMREQAEKAPEAQPDDQPVDYQTWRTGP
jgi:hypothetical protein